MTHAPSPPDRWRLLRYCAYALAAEGGVQALYQAVIAYGPGIAVENGALELLQIAVALAGGAALVAAGAVTQRGLTAIAFCAGALLYAAAREADLWFEQVAFDDAYKYLAGVPIAAAAAAVAWRDRRRWAESLEWTAHPASVFFLCGGLQVVVAAALFDRSRLWDSIENSVQADRVKRLVEESIELSGYLTLAAGACELLITCRREAAAASRAARQTDSASHAAADDSPPAAVAA
ncbi:hypothetical protein [Alienimonas chondri]|uniref:Uncharacterized protein n=1 Tax=Alienimonas chondri TaxID=2681879 RepID=A0ABX1VBT1_9PLAN|nr:hypothetical protein [Alienimonas chondri]NNJ25543.1 hypothetical protein [Alienimonas chondri]